MNKRKTSELLLVKQVIKLCEKANISRIRYGNFEIEFGDRKREVQTRYEGKESQYLDSPQSDMPPDDVMLFAATPSMDEMIQARKGGKKR